MTKKKENIDFFGDFFLFPSWQTAPCHVTRCDLHRKVIQSELAWNMTTVQWIQSWQVALGILMRSKDYNLLVRQIWSLKIKEFCEISYEKKKMCKGRHRYSKLNKSMLASYFFQLHQVCQRWITHTVTQPREETVWAISRLRSLKKII